MVYYFWLDIMPRENTERPEPEGIAKLINAWLDAGYIIHPGNASYQEMFREYPDSTSRETGAVCGLNNTRYIPESRTATFGAMCRWLFGRPPRQEAVTRLSPFPIPPDTEALSYLGGADVYVGFGIDISNQNTFGVRDPLQPCPDGRHQYNYSLSIHASDDFTDEACFNVPALPETICRCGRELRHSENLIRRFCPACGAAFRPQDQAVLIRTGGTINGGEGTELVKGGACHRFAIRIDCYVWGDQGLASCDPKASDEFLGVCCMALGMPLYGVLFYED